MMLKWLVLWLPLIVSGSCIPDSESVQTLSGVAVQITDGDTFVLKAGNNTHRIRLHAIDAPERGQDFYRVSKERLGRFLQGKTVQVRVVEKDRYGRLIGDVYVRPREYVNAGMVREGLAWHYKKHSSDPELASLERKARQARIGLWGQGTPVPPWEFRYQKRNR